MRTWFPFLKSAFPSINDKMNSVKFLVWERKNKNCKPHRLNLVKSFFLLLLQIQGTRNPLLLFPKPGKMNSIFIPSLNLVNLSFCLEPYSLLTIEIAICLNLINYLN